MACAARAPVGVHVLQEPDVLHHVRLNLRKRPHVLRPYFPPHGRWEVVLNLVLLELPQLVLVICIMQWCANVRACLLLLLLLERSPRLRRVLVVYPPSIA